MTAPPIAGVLETALYVADLPRARRFYEQVLGLSPMFADDRLAAYPVGRSVLLLFLKGATAEAIVLPGGTIPPHGGSGAIHFALAVAAADLPAWEARLAAHGVAEEARTHWPRGGTSVYFRDPDGHLGEFATPGIWPNEN
ncbi:VOC family protein [Roseomonas rosulenta]|uniref:VOC family protein n=1 Tax=Roseomonas rosulenta TaxID=2748667 RepID=UPI0018DF6C8F|nr:VOC family protein [Roseomonas rosulenta]